MTRSAELRPATGADTPLLADLLSHMDPEDAEHAEEIIGQGSEALVSIVEQDGRPIGFLGLSMIENAESSAWLDWNAFYPDVDRYVMFEAISSLNEQAIQAGLSRIFAMEADRAEGKRAQRHEMFLMALRDAGYQNATHFPEFYEPGEGALYLTMPLSNDVPFGLEPDHREVEFLEVFEHEESDGGYVLDWDYAEYEGSHGAGLHEQIEAARAEGARMLVCSCPSNLVGFESLVTGVGFRRAGELDGYYAPGLHEVQYILELR